MKKGQFTILVVFALIALIIIALAYFALNNIEGQDNQRESTEAAEEFVDSNSVRSYVKNCIQSVSENAIQLAGYQGGVLWKEQNGTVKKGTLGKNYSYINESGVNYNVSYLIRNISYARCPYLNRTVPEYPDEGANMSQLKSRIYWSNHECTYYRNSGFAGSRKMKELCTLNGTNWKGNIDRPDVYSTCEGRYGLKSESPLQTQLANYTETHLPRCADFEDFEQKQGYRIEVEEKPEVTYTFGKTDVKVNVTYPVRVSQSGQPPVSVNMNFYHRIDARLKQLYEYTRNIIRREIRNVTYNLSRGSSFLKRQGFEIELVENYTDDKNYGSEWEHDDLLRVIDNQSFVDGRQLMIQGYIQNRRPIVASVQAWSTNGEHGTTKSYTLNLTDYVTSPDDEKLDWEVTDFSSHPNVNNYFFDSGTATLDFDYTFNGCSCSGGSPTCTTENIDLNIRVIDDEGLSDWTQPPLQLRFNSNAPDGMCS